MKILKTRFPDYGFSHQLLLPVIVMVVVAGVGAKMLSASHANPLSTTPPLVASAAAQTYTDMPPGFTRQNGKLTYTMNTTPKAYPVCYGLLNCYYYGVMANGGTNALGASAHISLADPRLSDKDHHSLAELAVGDGNYNYVEVGWTVDKLLNGDSLPHLFVFHWINGAATCYNGCGWVAVKNNGTHYAGGVLPTTGDGAFLISYTNGNWIVKYDGYEIGYFPGSLWNNTFTKSTIVQAFGELSSSSANVPESEMGNGILGIRTNAAVIKKFALISPQTTNTLSYNAIGLPSKYAVGNYDSTCQTDCSMTFGGPGYAASAKPYINLDYITPQNTAIGVDGCATATPGAYIATVTFKWGDQNKLTVTNTNTGTNVYCFQASHMYPAANASYTVAATATDSNGVTATTTQPVTITAN